MDQTAHPAAAAARRRRPAPGVGVPRARSRARMPPASSSPSPAPEGSDEGDGLAPLPAPRRGGVRRAPSGLTLRLPAWAAGAAAAVGARDSGAAAGDASNLNGGGATLTVRPELAAISLVYLVQGLLGLSRLAVFVFFKDDLGLDPAAVGLLTGLGYAPWVIKPLYGFLSDSVPLWGYRRRSYLVLCGLSGAASWAALASVASPAAAAACLIAGSASTACADVVADSIVVELSRGEPQATAGALQSLCWASAAAGGVASAYFSGWAVARYEPRAVFAATGAFPLLVTLAAAAIPEERLATPRGEGRGRGGGGAAALAAVRAQAAALWGALSRREILAPALFVFAWQATPTADTAMLFFETEALGFSTEFLGRVRLAAALASLAGVGVYNAFLRRTPLRKMFLWSAGLGTALGMTQLVLITGLNHRLGLSDEAFALADSALLTVLGQVSFMPVLVLAARLCPEGVEATLFATLMSVLNGGAFVGSGLGSLLTRAFGVTATEFSGLAPLVALCTLCTLAPLPLLRLLPPAVDDDDEGGAGEGECKARREA